MQRLGSAVHEALLRLTWPGARSALASRVASWMRRVGYTCLVLLAACGARAADAAEHRFQLLIDTDNRSSTGCAVSTSRGVVDGVDEVWTTVVTTSTSSATVTRIERQTCAGGSLGAPVTFASAGWSAGIGNGTQGTAALETFVPLSLLPPGGTVRVAVASVNATGGQDATGAFFIALAPPPPLAGPSVPVPLSRWLLLALVPLLVAAAAWWLRRHPAHSRLAVWVVLLLASGLVWAAAVNLDGAVGDWNGIAPVAGNARGSAPVDANIVAVFHQTDAANLYVRIDADVRVDAGGNQPPLVSAGADQAITLGTSATLSGTASDDGLPNPPGTLTTTWTQLSGPGSVTFGNAHALGTTATFSQAGVYVLRLAASDGAGTVTDDVQITVSTGADQAPVAHDDSAVTQPGTPVQVNVLGNDTDADGDVLTVSAFTQGAHGSVACTAAGACTYTPNAGFSGSDSFTYTASDGRGGQANGTVSVNISSFDTTVNAPTIKGAYVTTIRDATAFLYTGSNPLQTGVAPGIIDPRRVAVLRGAVTTRDGSVLPGVTVTVLDHPEFGQTITRSNGRFDLAVNGGGVLTVRYAATGFLPLQRQVQVPWQDYVSVPTAALIQLDALVTTIDAAAGAAQVHRASLSSDGDGSRRASVFFPAGTTATMLLPNGSTQPLSTLHIRATEYTVGPNGPAAMPAGLPALSGYTYCVELSADEALAAGAVSVAFNQPVVTYAENFLGFPVGVNIPVGTYDPVKGVWVPQSNGRVVRILGITGGVADVDTDGDGVADSGLGITAEERSTLATLYSAGQTIWRVPVAHFSSSDSNWRFAVPSDAVAPGQNGAGPNSAEALEDGQCSAGSIVECENRVLGESVAIVGTPLTLNYRSDRVPGQVAKRTIRLSGASVPATLSSIGVHLSVAGRNFDQTFPAAANQQTTFVWDRLDAYGRQTLGGQTLSVKIDYNYPTTYVDPGPLPTAFNSIGGVSLAGNAARQELSISQTFTTTIGEGLTDARAIGLGGWTLSGHNVYDANARVAHLGNGARRRAGSLARTLTTIDLPGQSILFDVEVGPDGSQYVALPHGDQIIRIAPDGTQSVFAGNGTEGFGGDGGPATAALLGDPTGVAVAPDGSVYIAEQANFRVRKVAPDGKISTVAGTGVAGSGGDGGPATSAQLSFAERVAVGPDSSLYILDGQRVRRVATDGVIDTIAGTGAVGGSGDGGPARAATLNASSISVAPDGGVYIADFDNHRIRRVDPGGIITTVADYTGEAARPVSVRPTADGNLLVALEPSGAATPRIDLLKRDGTKIAVAGGGPSPIQEGIPATQVNLVGIRAVAVAPDGAIFVVTGNGSSRVLRISPALPGFEGTVSFIASADGGQLYVFDEAGKHVRTLHALTGAVLYEFGYDSAGRLTTFTEKTGGVDNVTTIQHDSAGNPTAIVGPFGQVTTLAVDSNGFLSSVTNPAGDSIAITSDAAGLITTFTDPRGKTSHFAFDADGRLSQDTDAAGGSQDLAASTIGDRFLVTRTTALGRATSYATQNLAGNRQVRTLTQPDGTVSKSDELIDAGTVRATASDGTFVDAVLGPDPRFGMEASITTSVSMVLPSGLALSASRDASAVLGTPLDPLSVESLSDTVTVDGRTTRSTYTAATRTLVTTTPAGRTSSIVTDALGRVVSTQVGGLDTVSVTYDARGRIATYARGSGASARVHALSYNAQGFVQSVTDPLGRVVQFSYDAAGRVVGKTLADGQVAAFAYDAAGNVTSVAPPGRPAHGFAFSDRNQLAAETPPVVAGTGATSYAYNADGQLTQVSRPDGRTISIGYDAFGRVATRTQATSGVTTGVDTTAYDSAGRLASVAAASGVTTSYAYDGSPLTGRTWSGPVNGSVTVTHDASLRVSSEAVNGAATIAYTYDADDLLIGVGPLTISRDAQNGLSSGSVVGNTNATIAHDGFGDLVSYGLTAGGSPVFGDGFTRDKLARVTQKTESIAGGATDTYGYAYDAIGQLTSVTRNAVEVERYSYDANGNRTGATVGGVTVAATYDDQDRLVQYGSTTFTYTAAGELQTRTAGANTTSYQYDALGNLLAVTLPGGTAIGYIVDGNNRRVGKRINGTLVKGFLYGDALRPAAELDGAGAVVSRFGYAGGNAPAIMIKGGVVFRIVTDQVGSVRLVIDTTTGAIAQRLDYDTFGNVVLDTNPGFQPFGFAGGLYDPDTGLVRFGVRDYDPAIGRWTAKDTSGVIAGDSNLYRYARNDPVNKTDVVGAAASQPPSPIDKELAKLASWLDDITDVDIPTDLPPEETAQQVAKRARNLEVEDRLLTKIQKLLRIKQNAKVAPEKLGGGCGGLKAFEFMNYWQAIKAGIEYLQTGEEPTWQDLLEEQIYGHRLPEEYRQYERRRANEA